jgi:hypothetical protein
MKICTDPRAIATIDLDECLGLSLATINTNFELLKEANCLTSEEVAEKQTEIQELTTKVNSLSENLFKIAQATVSFDGTYDPANLITSSRVVKVDRLSTGVFELSFVPAFSDTNYLVLGSCLETSISSKYVWVAPTLQTLSTTTINTRNENGDFVNPNYVNVTIFSK